MSDRGLPARSEGVRSSRAKFWAARLLLAAMPCLGFGITGEFLLRRDVPRSGLTPFQMSADPSLPYELRPSFETRYKGVSVQTDAQGLRRRLTPRPERPELRIALVGDSVTFGNAIENEATLAVQLEHEFAARGRTVEVINGGVPGYSALDVSAFADARVLPSPPDLLAYVFVSNDVTPSKRPKDIPEDAVIDAFEDFPLHSALLQFLGVRVNAMRRRIGSAEVGGWVQKTLDCFEQGGRDRVREAVVTLRDHCAQAHVRFEVLSYPFLVRPDGNPYRGIDQWFAATCAELEVEHVDLLPALGETEDLTRFWASPFDSHPNAEANRLVASFLAEHWLSMEATDRAEH